ncbi:MAG: FecR domain-containing protein [Magnetococcales bacterium]|nr:FecR domain-containing protein [Magnetococcales bacterium]
MGAISLPVILAKPSYLALLRLIKRIFFLNALFVLLLILGANNSEAGNVLLGTIEKIVGDVRIMSGSDSFSPAMEGQKFYVGDNIQTLTKSRALLVYKDGAEVKLGDETTIIMDQAQDAKGQKPSNITELSHGSMFIAVDPTQKTALFVFRSPTAEVGVRGTEFVAVAEDDVSTFMLNRGKLDVSGGDSQFIMNAGEMTANIASRRMIKPVDMEQRAGLKAVRDRILEATSLDKASILSKKKSYGEILARFYINYASYLVDVGNFYDAITVLMMAKSLTKKDDIRAETSSLIASINAHFLNDMEGAANQYYHILTNYPDSPQYEAAFYHYGLLLKTRGNLDVAQQLFIKYLEEFPNGNYNKIVRELLESM